VHYNFLLVFHVSILRWFRDTAGSYTQQFSIYVAYVISHDLEQSFTLLTGIRMTAYLLLFASQIAYAIFSDITFGNECDLLMMEEGRAIRPKLFQCFVKIECWMWIRQHAR